LPRHHWKFDRFFWSLVVDFERVGGVQVWPGIIEGSGLCVGDVRERAGRKSRVEVISRIEVVGGAVVLGLAEVGWGRGKWGRGEEISPVINLPRIVAVQRRGLITSDGKDTADVEARIRQANGASGSLLKCVFKRKDVTKEAKVAVYNSLVLSVLLYGCKSWSLTQRLRDKLRSFHRACARSMCRINMWHVQHYRITAQDLEHRLGVRSFGTYLVRRRLRWLGYVRRMPWDRLPRKLLTA
jgi:hypothetical protein